MVQREVEITTVSIYLKIVRIFTRTLAFIATVTSAIFGYMEHCSKRGEPIGKVMLWVSENVPLSARHWAVIAVSSGMILFFLIWRTWLNRMATTLPEIRDDHELGRRIRWHLIFTAVLRRRPLNTSIYLCTRERPSCACAHGAAIVLSHVSNPAILLCIVVWLRRKLGSDPREVSYPLHLLNLLAKGLHRLIRRQSVLWPKDFKRTLWNLTVDAYACTARHVMWNLEKSCFLRWQQSVPERTRKSIIKGFSLGEEALKEYRKELRNEQHQFIDLSWQVFHSVAAPVEKWLDSTDTPAEVEETVLTRVIPTMLGLPVNNILTYDEIGVSLPGIQQFARSVSSRVVRNRDSVGFELWLQRLELIITTSVCDFLFRWLSIPDKQALLQRIWRELVHLYDEGFEGRISEERIGEVFGEFDKQMVEILSNSGHFEKDWVQDMAEDIQKLSERVGEDEGALPIISICNSLEHKFRAVLEIIDS